MVERTFRLTQFQKSDGVDLELRTLRTCQQMYDSFFKQRRLIPAGRFHELSFSNLEQDPVGQVRQIYEALGLPDFAQAEAGLKAYLDSTAGYPKEQVSGTACRRATPGRRGMAAQL